MRASAIRWSIVVPWAITVGLFVALLIAAAIGGASWIGSLESITLFGLVGLWGVADATVGAIILIRRPGNRIGRMLQAGGPLVITAVLGFLVSAMRILTAGPADPIAAVGGWWASISFLPAIMTALPLVVVIFPDGHLPGSRWRWPVLLVIGGELSTSAVHAITIGPEGEGLPNNPFGVLGVPPEISATLPLIGTLLLFASFAIAFAAVGVRWHRGDRPARAQLKWLLGAVAVFAILVPLSFGGGPPNLLDYLGIASATLLPISIAIAVLRYHLYDIDRIISRTLTYGLLTAVLVAVYAIGFVLLQALLAQFTTGGGTLAVAISTLVAFAISQPLRRRLQSGMDRRFNRSRYDAERTVDGFATHLRDEFDLERVGSELGAVVARSLAPASVGVWLRPPGWSASR
jgi:hypothetical protein